MGSGCCLILSFSCPSSTAVYPTSHRSHRLSHEMLSSMTQRPLLEPWARGSDELDQFPPKHVNVRTPFLLCENGASWVFFSTKYIIFVASLRCRSCQRLSTISRQEPSLVAVVFEPLTSGRLVIHYTTRLPTPDRQIWSTVYFLL